MRGQPTCRRSPSYGQRPTIRGYAAFVDKHSGVSPLVEPLAKDQYKIYGELTQKHYDGGVIKKPGSNANL